MSPHPSSPTSAPESLTVEQQLTVSSISRTSSMQRTLQAPIGSPLPYHTRQRQALPSMRLKQDLGVPKAQEDLRFLSRVPSRISAKIASVWGLRGPEGQMRRRSCRSWCGSMAVGNILAPIVYRLRLLNKATGGDALGSASDKLYQPDGLLRQAEMNGQPILWVGINYRLGGAFACSVVTWEMLSRRTVFGFATSKALKALKHTNAGLRDQRAAFDCGSAR